MKHEMVRKRARGPWKRPWLSQKYGVRRPVTQSAQALGLTLVSRAAAMSSRNRRRGRGWKGWDVSLSILDRPGPMEADLQAVMRGAQWLGVHG